MQHIRLVLAASMCHELAARGPERVADRDVGIFVSTVGRAIVAGHDVGPGDHNRHPHVKRLALALVLVRAFDHDLTALDTRIDVPKLCSPAVGEALEGARWVHVSKSDVQWK